MISGFGEVDGTTGIFFGFIVGLFFCPCTSSSPRIAALLASVLSPFSEPCYGQSAVYKPHCIHYYWLLFNSIIS